MTAIKVFTATFENLQMARIWNRAIKTTLADDHTTAILHAREAPNCADEESSWKEFRITERLLPAPRVIARAMPREGVRLFIEEDIIPLRPWRVDGYPATDGGPTVLCGIGRSPWWAFAILRYGVSPRLSKGYSKIIQHHAREMERPEWIDSSLWELAIEADAKIVGNHFLHVDRVSNFHKQNPAKQKLIDALDELIPQIETPIPRPLERAIIANKAREKRESFLAQVTTCPHRGEVTRQVKCKLCGGREKMIDVYHCDRFNTECTIDPHKSGQAEKVCKRCEVFSVG
jgi:hypothetical protein